MVTREQRVVDVVIEMTREQRLRRAWVFSSLMAFACVISLACTQTLLDPAAILIGVHGVGWALLAISTRGELERLRLRAPGN